MISLNLKLHANLFKSLLENIDYKDAYDFIKLRQFTKYDHQLSYRELNHWSSQGLLFEQNEKGNGEGLI